MTQPLIDVLRVIMAYLLGSLCFGLIVSQLRGLEILETDHPGGSGVYRRMGAFWALLVTALDLGKGILAALLAAGGSSPWLIPLCALAVVAGHNWSVFFGFRGGGGIATSTGFFLALYPAATLEVVIFGLLVVLIYYLVYWRKHRTAIYPFPVGAICGFAALFVRLWSLRVGVWAVALVALMVTVRGLQMLKQPASSHKPEQRKFQP